MSAVDAVETKPALRRSVLAARTRLTPAARAAADEARTAAVLAVLVDGRWPAAARPGMPPRRPTCCVTCYVSVGTEPDTSRLLAALAAAGVRVLLPRLRHDGGLDWVVDEGPGARRPGPRGVPEPAGPTVDPASAEAWLVPALGVDHLGTRLGRGGGAYDRALPTGVPAVALLHEGELVDALPRAPHDRPVTHVALPAAVLPLPAPTPAEMRRVATDTPL